MFKKVESCNGQVTRVGINKVNPSMFLNIDVQKGLSPTGVQFHTETWSDPVHTVSPQNRPQLDRASVHLAAGNKHLLLISCSWCGLKTSNCVPTSHFYHTMSAVSPKQPAPTFPTIHLSDSPRMLSLLSTRWQQSCFKFQCKVIRKDSNLIYQWNLEISRIWGELNIPVIELIKKWKQK